MPTNSNIFFEAISIERRESAGGKGDVSISCHTQRHWPCRAKIFEACKPLYRLSYVIISSHRVPRVRKASAKVETIALLPFGRHGDPALSVHQHIPLQMPIEENEKVGGTGHNSKRQHHRPVNRSVRHFQHIMTYACEDD